jgi:hypothetical protein
MLFERFASLREWHPVARCDGVPMDAVGAGPHETARSGIPHLDAQALHTTWRYSRSVGAAPSGAWSGRPPRHFESGPEPKAASGFAAGERNANMFCGLRAKRRRRARMFGNGSDRCGNREVLVVHSVDDLSALLPCRLTPNLLSDRASGYLNYAHKAAGQPSVRFARP